MLTDTKIRNTKASDKAVKLTDGLGLYLEVRPNGAKKWQYRYRLEGKANLLAMGDYAQPGPGETEELAKERRAGRPCHHPAICNTTCDSEFAEAAT